MNTIVFLVLFSVKNAYLVKRLKMKKEKCSDIAIQVSSMVDLSTRLVTIVIWNQNLTNLVQGLPNTRKSNQMKVEG